jgi:predicted MPP superfamily phosphohydrolase
VTRRQWIHLAAAGGLTASGSALYARTVEPMWFDVTHTPVFLPKLRYRFRALHLADLHSSRSVPTPLLREAVRTAVRTKPDVIFLTGDYISTLRAYDAAGLVELFRRLSDAAPAFAVMGNHDSSDDGYGHASLRSTQPMRELQRGGVRVLHNRSEAVEIKGQQVRLVGLGDLWNRSEFVPDDAFAEAAGDLPTILLAHNPDTKDKVLDQPWDLMLSGHTHGGQVVLPLIHPYWLPVRDQRFIAGLYGWQNRQLFITRGVGSPTGIRFRCRPEVSVLEFQPGLPPANTLGHATLSA